MNKDIFFLGSQLAELAYSIQGERHVDEGHRCKHGVKNMWQT